MTNRLKYFALHGSYILLLVQGKVRITNIPEGASYLRCQYDFLRDSLLIVIEHPSFEVVPPHCEPPLLSVEIEMVEG